MSGSAFEVEEDFDFEKQFMSSLNAAEDQEGDVSNPDFEDEQDYAPQQAPQESEPQPAAQTEQPAEEPAQYQDYAPADSGYTDSTYADDSYAQGVAESTYDASNYTDNTHAEEDITYAVADESDDATYGDTQHEGYAPQEASYEDSSAYQAPEPVYAQPEPVAQPQPVQHGQQQPPAQPAPPALVEEELMADDTAGIDPQSYGTPEIQNGIDRSVSLETLEEAFGILDAYRSLEPDEQEFAAIFMDLGDDAEEPEIVSTVMNANPLLYDVFSAIEEAYRLDATEIAFHIVGLSVSVIEGISFVAAAYLKTDVVDSQQKKIPYAREVVSQLRKMDDNALRLVSAAHALIKGEVLSEDDRLSH